VQENNLLADTFVHSENLYTIKKRTQKHSQPQLKKKDISDFQNPVKLIGTNEHSSSESSF